MPYMRPMATITRESQKRACMVTIAADDTLAWYQGDDYGAGVHDVIGSRCDPYTNAVLRGGDYDHCCHSNLSRALSCVSSSRHSRRPPRRTAEPFVASLGASLSQDPVVAAVQAEAYVHDVMNVCRQCAVAPLGESPLQVFMCTGFDRSTRKYFMKATPARQGDFIEFFAEIPLLGGLSACPGGNCGSSHSDDSTPCFALLVEVFQGDAVVTQEWPGSPPVLRSAFASISVCAQLPGVAGEQLLTHARAFQETATCPLMMRENPPACLYVDARALVRACGGPPSGCRKY